jgi:NADH dehydrogenase FAD-containing subunit
MTQPSPTAPSVVVIGGGYGGIAVASGLDDVADVTLVEPKDAFVHNVAAWRALVEPEWLERIFFPYSGLLRNGRVVHERAAEVEPGRVVLASGHELAAGYIVLATGSTYPFPAKSDVLDAGDARAKYRVAHAALTRGERVLVVGAGPAGLELAGEIKAAFPGKHVTIVDAADDILSGPFDPELRAELRRQLDGLGVELLLGSPLRGQPPSEPAAHAPFTITTERGADVAADVWYRAYGVRPVTGYLGPELAAARGGGGDIAVTPELRVEGQDTVFALGDIVGIDAKMAGVAGREAQTVVENLRALITGEGEVRDYEPMPPAIFIPLGPEGGAGQLPGADSISGPDVVAEIKGRHMLVDRYAELFGEVVLEGM